MYLLQHRRQPAEDAVVLGWLASRVALPAFVPLPASRQGDQLAAGGAETMAIVGKALWLECLEYGLMSQPAFAGENLPPDSGPL